MRSSIIWSLLLFLSLSLTARAQTRDPWVESDTRFQSEGLCISFPNGTERTIAHSAWSRFGREEWNYDVRVSCAADASGQEVATIQNLSKGRVFSTSTIKESEWDSYQGNLLRQKAIATESFGMRFTLVSVQDLTGDRQRFDYRVHSSSGKLVEEGYWVLGQGPVLEMIIERYTKKYSVIVEETRDVLVP
jgi:hypothetical protein